MSKKDKDKSNQQLLMESIDLHKRIYDSVFNMTDYNKERFENNYKNEKIHCYWADCLRYFLLFEIGETWSGKFCSLCKRYSVEVELGYILYDNYKQDCGQCPINLSGNCCNQDDSPWQKLNQAENFEEFLEASKNMINLLQDLFDKEIS